MTLSRDEVKIIVSLERQIDNHGILRIAFAPSRSKVIRFEADKGWTVEEEA